MSNKPIFRLSDTEKIHFVGVGGIGMSALARFFLQEKKIVSGSDREATDLTEALEKEGVEFYSKQVKENIADEIDLVVYTEAMPQDHEELVAAREKGIVTVNYFDALGVVANEYYLIAVSGTHGKTTTTAMLTDVLEMANLDPTAIIGSLRSKTKSNFRAGKSKYCIVEACEYKRDFLSLTPDVLIITNLEHEHVDYYKNLYDVQTAFRSLAEQVREDGVIVYNSGDVSVVEAIKDVDVQKIDYSKSIDPMLSLKQPGMHNLLNAGAATAAAEFVGVSKEVSKKALEEFTGTWRRFEYKGETSTGATIIDDYSHHPTEVRAGLASAREKYPKKNIVVAFKPHTYSRTHELFNDFATAMKEFDRVVLLPIYSAREENIFGVTSEKLKEAIGEKATYVSDFEEANELLRNTTTKNDVVITMGAGDITNLADMLVS